ncbi:YidC/Oxa1 family membrane protein insertase [Colletotrichum truncatum]|uniref:YidC/Oxa1 family membrane protein insertase n=1 Tax=Colletotrichum truncatum TaxID=5467 RepID=A0ACC3ZH22_COLTU
MLPSRGVLRSLPSARATSSISSQAISRAPRRLGNGRQFSTSLRSGAAPWTALRTANSRLAGSMAIGGSLETRRAISLWNKNPNPESTASASAPPQSPVLSQQVEPAAFDSAAAAAAPSSVPPPAEPIAAVADAAPSASSIPEIDAASLLDLPEQIGYLKTLGLDFGWGPSSVMQWALEHVHVYSGLPWWGSIAATAILLRLALLKPLLKSQETTARLQILQRDPKYEELKNASLEATTRGDSKAMMEYRRDLAMMNRAAGVNPLNALWGFLQIPFGYGMFRVLNGACSIPVPGLENGGFLWVTDLSVPDPLYILPILGPLTMFAMMRTAGANATAQQKAQQKLMMWILGPISVGVTLYLPGAVQWYFFVSGAIGVVQNYLLTLPSFRRNPAFNTIPATGTYQAPRAGSNDDGSIKGVFANVQQTIHKAKGGAGNYVEEARKREEAKTAEKFQEKKLEQHRQRNWGNIRK